MAEFHRYTTGYDVASKCSDWHSRDTARAFCKAGPIRRTLEMLDSHGQHLDKNQRRKHFAEISYYLNGRPYYRVYPDYVPMLAATDLRVPCKHLQSPYPAFAVRLPKGFEPRVGNLSLMSFLFHRFDSENVDDLCSALSRADCREESDLFWSSPEMPGFVIGLQVIASMDGRPDPYAMTMSCAIANLDRDMESLASGRLVDEAEYTDAIDDGCSVDRTALLALSSVAMRIGVSICFLASGQDKILEPDVLNKDFKAYLEAVNRKNHAEVRRLHDKSIKVRGESGFAVGRTDALLGRKAYDVDTSATHDKTGRELKYRHSRRAHFHTYRTGPQRSETKIRFVRMLVIRPDLPPAPEEAEKGFSTPKRLTSREEHAPEVRADA